MLKNIDPILSPELLAVLRGMGHGDDIALVDANFPGMSMGKRLVRLDGLPLTRVLDAVLSVLPLDDFVPEAAWRMQVVEKDDPGLPVFADLRLSLDRNGCDGFGIAALERFDFYAQARAAFAVVQTGEARPYGNIILRKGIIQPD